RLAERTRSLAASADRSRVSSAGESRALLLRRFHVAAPLSGRSAALLRPRDGSRQPPALPAQPRIAADGLRRTSLLLREPGRSRDLHRPARQLRRSPRQVRRARPPRLDPAGGVG